MFASGGFGALRVPELIKGRRGVRIKLLNLRAQTQALCLRRRDKNQESLP